MNLRRLYNRIWYNRAVNCQEKVTFKFGLGIQDKIMSQVPYPMTEVWEEIGGPVALHAKVDVK